MKDMFVSKVAKHKLSLVELRLIKASNINKPVPKPKQRLWIDHFYVIYQTWNNGKDWHVSIETNLPERTFNHLPDNFSKPELLSSYFALAPAKEISNEN